MDALKYIDDPNFYAVYFRRTTQQLERSLWPEAKEMYLPFLVDSHGRFIGKAKIREKDHKIIFPSGAMLEFSYMEHDKDAMFNWQGAQLSGVYWDEFVHFSEYQFNYLRTRLRSKSKYPSFMRASMNPDPDHFVLHSFIEPWILEDGLPDYSLSGKIRYFIMDNGRVISSWNKEELQQEWPDKAIRTYSFIPSTIKDNPKMLEVNPDYEEELAANNPAETEALKNGNWKSRPKGSGYFKREWLQKGKPPLGAKSCRAHDKAASEPSEVDRHPDFTASVKISKSKDGYYYIQGSYHPRYKDEASGIAGKFRKRAGERDHIIELQAIQDGTDCHIVFAADPGSSGKVEFEESSKKLTSKGFVVKRDPVPIQKSKLTRFTPFASACENGLVYIDEESFGSKITLEAFYKELEAFDGERSSTHRKDD